MILGEVIREVFDECSVDIQAYVDCGGGVLTRPR
jgi:hypothetical protein